MAVHCRNRSDRPRCICTADSLVALGRGPPCYYGKALLAHCGLVLFFVDGIFFSFGGLWAGPYLIHVYGMNRAEAGHILNMIAVGMIIGSPLVGFLSDRVFHSRKKVLALASTVLFLLNSSCSTYSLRISPILALCGLFGLFDHLRGHCGNRLHHYQGIVSRWNRGHLGRHGESLPILGRGHFSAPCRPALGCVPKAATGAYSLDGYRAMLLAFLAASVIAVASTFFMKETYPGWTFRK